MGSKQYYLGVDQGTTGTTALLLDEAWRPAGQGYREHSQCFPHAGWVEQDPLELWQAALDAVSDALAAAGADGGDIISLGLCNQGETCMIWDRESGLPLYNAIVWQDRRTARQADLFGEQHGTMIRERTGLVVDSYFSATKIRWLLDHVEGAREQAERGMLLAGTLDSWLIWKLTGGRAFVTDRSTASRTMLFNIHTGAWDQEILELLEIPESILPCIEDSAALYGTTSPDVFFGAAVPVSASLVDQQAALFGQGCHSPGGVKTTYGTGCFMLMNTGQVPVYSDKGLLTTVGWSLNGEMTYALDGGVYIAGAAIQWLRDKLELFSDAAQAEAMASQVKDSGGVYFVPAFAGLAAPHWDQYARGTIVGLTGGTTSAHLVRATLESTVFQVKDILDAMNADAGIPIGIMRADGGMATNNLLMQFQADILGIPVDVPEITETTALGAAFMAACGVGAYSSLEELRSIWRLGRRFEPQMGADQRECLLHNWHRAVERSLGWAEEVREH